MRSLRLALSVCAGLAAGPVFAGDLSYGGPPSSPAFYRAQPMLTGDVSLALGWYNPAKGKSSGEFLGEARINLPINELWNAQVEVSTLTSFKKNYYNFYGGYGHLYYKDPQYALGAYVGGQSVTGGSGFSTGLEAALFLPSTTVKGYAGYTWASGFADFWTFAGIVDWYLNPNTKLEGLVAYWNGGGDAWIFRAGAEHLFAGTNVSLFGNATYYDFNKGRDAWEFIAGGRFAFGEPRGTDLQRRDWNRPFAIGTILSF